jgi:lipopolysaccharide transport system permease protein
MGLLTSAVGSTRIAHLKQSLRLSVDLARRSMFGRYRETMLGAAWSVIQPLVMLAIYAFVFSQVFQARWEVDTDRPVNFAVVLFSGLLIFNFFNESLVNSTGVIISNSALIKRTGVASSTLPFSVVIAALFNVGLSAVPFVIAYLFTSGVPPITSVALPIVFVPLVAMVLGLVFIVSSLSVFVRDTQPMVIILSSLVLFLSPIFYPESAIPEQFRALVLLSPIGVPLSASKDVLFAGDWPQWGELAIYSGVAVLVLAAGTLLFRKAQRGFADVL